MATPLKEGDYARWVTNRNKVVSRDTKTLVNKIGKILLPRDETNGGTCDVEFTYKNKPFVVWNIPENELVRVDAP